MKPPRASRRTTERFSHNNCETAALARSGGFLLRHENSLRLKRNEMKPPLRKPGQSNHLGIVMGLLFAVFLWGGNNTALKFLVKSWPPVTVASTRFLCAGLVMFALLRWTNW